jgi:hypothetical protein
MITGHLFTLQVCVQIRYIWEGLAGIISDTRQGAMVLERRIALSVDGVDETSQ